MLQMNQHYEPEFKKMIVRLHIEEGRSLKSLAVEYGVSHANISIRKFNICPNAYYNYLKNRKADYHQHKDEIKNSIREIYHSHSGVDGYKTIHAYLIRK